MLFRSQKIPRKYDLHNKFSLEYFKLCFKERLTRDIFLNIESGYSGIKKADLNLSKILLEPYGEDFYFYETGVLGRENL